MDNITKILGISDKNVRPTSKNDTFVVVVQYSWLKQLMKYKKLDFSQKSVYDESWRISDNPLPPWTKIIIRVFSKKNGKVLPLPRSKLGSGKVDAPLSFSQLLSYVSQTNHRNLWKESYKKHSIQYSSHSTKDQSTVNVLDYTNLLYEVILRLYGCNIIKIKVDPTDPTLQTSELVSGRHPSKVYEAHSNVLPVICAVDMEESLFLIHHFHYDFTLLDCIVFSPAVLEQSYARCLFVIYQILQTMKSMYNRGLNFGEIGLEDIYTTENLWIQISPQITSNIHIVSPGLISEHNKTKAKTLNEQFASHPVKTYAADSERKETLSREDKVILEKLCALWVQGCLSNLDYLVHLNVVAGRRAGDPTAHHVLPWVTDFSSICGKHWRDLTKSKYRLNKGDRQLDMTYDVMSKELHATSTSPQQIPHHVSDVLSDITYYVYMARRTPKNVLCRNVRYNWVPAEYPSSIQRMQEWTPDECIPEFFTDPTVFKSIHEDLADLEIPAWATCVEDFVTKHREALESVQVSESLHHWIDLTFGYKLSGTAAVKAKNVCLSLVDGHTALTRAGPVQLFACAHPARPPALAHCWGAKLPPRIYWQREKKKVIKSNESSEDISDDEEDDSNLPQNYSSLNIPPNHRHSSLHSSRHKSTSRTRKHSKRSDDSSCSSVVLSNSNSVTSINEPKVSTLTTNPHHFKVQKSERGKGQIYLPKEYNPLWQLSAIENLHNFNVKTFYKQKGDDLENEIGQNVTKTTTVDNGASPKYNDLSNVNQVDMMCDENSFTNQMFVASYEQNLLKRQKTEVKDTFLKDRNANTKFVTNATLFKQLVLANRKKDMQVFGCLIIEIFLHQKIRPFQVRAAQSFDERYKVCRLVLKNNISILPKCVRHMACLLLQIEDPAKSGCNVECTPKYMEDLLASSVDVNYPCINKNGLPPSSAVQLLQPLLTNHLFPFPSHFSSLNSMISVLHEYSVADRELNILYSFECDGQDCSKYQCFDKSKLYFTQKIAEAKVHSCSLQLENFFNQINTYNQFDSVDLFISHFIELLANKDTSILTAWYLFDPIAKALGPLESSKKLLNLILTLYDDHSGEKHENRNLSKTEPSHSTATYSNKKLVKLYHDIFLLQLIVRFGLQCFLENFVPHLVEAVGGYKDINSAELPMHSHANNIAMKTATSLKKLTYCEDSAKTCLTAPHDILSPDTSCGSENTLTPCIDKDCSLSMDKSKKSQCENALENEVFHIDINERNADTEALNHWETNLLNKSKIKCLIEDIDSAASSPNLDIYLNHTQALEATESICGVDEDDSCKSDADQINKCSEEMYFDDNNYGSTDTSPTHTDKNCTESSRDRRCGPTSPTIAIPSSCRTFKSYVETPDEDVEDSNVLSPNDKNTSQSLELNKSSNNSHKSKMGDKQKSSENSSRRSTQLYLSCNNVKDYKISEMSSRSLIWLAHRLGPVLTSKHLSRNLLKMLTLCYMGQENLMPLKDGEVDQGLDSLCIANSRLVGDCNATKVIECLTSIAALYGEQIILLQYFPHMGDLIASCRRRISNSLEGGLIACLQLLRFLIPYMSDVKLMEQLQDIILKNILHPTVRLISSTRSTFPSGYVARSALARKFLETLYVIALRIGSEMTKKHLCVPALQRFFLAFDKAHGSLDDLKNPDSDPIQMEATVPETESTSVDDGTSYLEICRDGSTAEWRVRGGQLCLANTANRDSSASPPDQPHTAAMSALEELQSVFDAELAHQSYVPFYKFVGEETIDRSLKNHLTLRTLCQEYDKNRGSSVPCNVEHIPPESADIGNKQSLEPNPVRIGMDVHLGRSESVPCKTNHQQPGETSNSNSFGSNVAIIGNRIEFQSDPGDGDVPKSAIDIVSCKMENGLRSSRHLRGDWLMYWEHEIGRSDKDNRFNLKQIKLQTFSGHSNAVRNIVCLDNENSFMTGSKDKTVKLWSLRNQGDGSSVSNCQWTYTGHRKGILSLTFLDSLRLAVSTDASVHIWDPYVESIVAQLDNSRSAPVSIVKAMPAPSALVLAATTDTVLRLIDTRICSYIHELKVSFNPNTFIRCICVSPSGRWVALGLASGHLALVEPRTGALRAHWKAHDGEVLQLVAAGESFLVSSSLDQTVLVWSTTDGKLKFQLKGSTEPVHCLSTYYNELISGTTNNRIGVHTAVDPDASFSSTKLRSDTFKGVLTSMAVLPLNRMLLLGGESGSVSLLC